MLRLAEKRAKKFRNVTRNFACRNRPCYSLFQLSVTRKLLTSCSIWSRKHASYFMIETYKSQNVNNTQFDIYDDHMIL